MNKRVRLFSLLLILVLAFVTACAPNGSNEEIPETGETISIGTNNWASNVAVSNLWTVLLEEKGYDVQLMAMEKSPLWIGISEGDVDLATEAWLPSTDQELADKFEGSIEIGDSWYIGGGQGLGVPAYVEDVNSIEDLNENKDLFLLNGNPSIIGTEAGTGLMQMTDQAVQEYGLELDVIYGSEVTMLTALGQAFEKQEPILVPLWNPHWMFAEYDLKYLEDPKKIYGEGDDIYYFTRLGFKDDHPDVVNWLNQWEMDDDSLGSLMTYIEESESPEEGTKKWVEDNRELVDRWLQ